MKNLAWKNMVSMGWPIAALLVVAAFPPTAVGAERVVLGEEFTATW